MILSMTSSLLLDKNKFKYLAEIGVNKPRKLNRKLTKAEQIVLQHPYSEK